MVAVALHPEGVDRNSSHSSHGVAGSPVALHPEGVDRNADRRGREHIGFVALHPEGVDRNNVVVELVSVFAGRPPPGGRG